MTQTLLLLTGLFTAMTLAVAFYWNNKTTRFIVIAMFVVLSNAIYFSLDGVKGWPAEEPNEVKGTLASVVIVNPSNTDDGGIYISLFPTTPLKWYEYEYSRHAPKTFFIEYSNDRAAEFENAKQALEEGKEVRINGIPPKNGSGSTNSSTGEETDIISDLVGVVRSLFSPDEDTYQPSMPDIDVLSSPIPPQKGSQ